MGEGVFSTIYITVQIEVLLDALKVLFKRNVSTNFVADCRPGGGGGGDSIYKKGT